MPSTLESLSPWSPRILCARWDGSTTSTKAIAIQEANARLIAAAPDLLAALRAVQHNRSCSCYVTVGKPCARCEVGYDEVDSAIAKAEGR
jgi:hypothetical protein